MKKYYSFFAPLAMMVIALCFTACSNDDDDNDDGGSDKKTLIVDGESYYNGRDASTVEQTRGHGMYLTVHAAETSTSSFHQINGHILTVVIPPSRVSELNVGQVFDHDHFTVREFRGFMELDWDTYDWNIISGEIVITNIKASELTIQIKKLTIEHERTSVRHTIEGTATLRNYIMGSDGEGEPFSEF